MEEINFLELNEKIAKDQTPIIKKDQVRFESVNLSELEYELNRKFDIDWLENAAVAVGVRSEEEAKGALSMALQARKLCQAIESSRSEIVRPHIDFQRAINKLVRGFVGKLCAIENQLEGKINDWLKSDKGILLNASDDFKISVEDGSMQVKHVWDFEVLDEKEIPREFLQVDMEAIERAVNCGIRKIPGVEIKQKQESKLRIQN